MIYVVLPPPPYAVSRAALSCFSVEIDFQSVPNVSFCKSGFLVK